MPYRIWLILGWSTCLDQVWPSIPCLHILHMQYPLLLVFSRLIWMLMVLTVVWYFEISQVEDLVQSTWVHHFAVVQLRVLLILIMVVIRVISVLLSPDFSSPWFFLFCWVQFSSELLFIVHIESSVVCSPLSLHLMYSLFHLVIWFFYSKYVLFSFSWVWFTYVALMCVMLSMWDIFSLIHNEHFDLTYHGGFWSHWPRIKGLT